MDVLRQNESLSLRLSFLIKESQPIATLRVFTGQTIFMKGLHVHFAPSQENRVLFESYAFSGQLHTTENDSYFSYFFIFNTVTTQGEVFVP